MDDLLRQLAAAARLGPARRVELQRALRSGEPGAMRVAGTRAAADLQRSGELVRVRIQGRDDDRALFALRGHADLLDLTPLISRGTTPPPPVIEPPLTDVAASGSGDPIMSDFKVEEGLIHALEQAQDLQTVSRQDGETADVIEPILQSLSGYLPDLDLHLELNDPHVPPADAQRLFRTDPDDRPFWAASRVRGEAVWLPGRGELPASLAARCAPPDSAEDRLAGVAVPVYAPRLDDADEEQAEVGLLYVLASSDNGREALMRLGARLSRFVTQSWHQRLHMNRLVHTDALTGVRNRGFYDAQFGLELERCKRQESTLVLLIGDIDHFKSINDTYGHPTGDRVLKTVARELLNGLRRIDIVCRIGGEEFALLLPDTELEAASDVVTRIQVRIANLRLTDPDHEDPIRVTISFGGVAYPEGGEDPERLHELADKMLYLSKERGRNRCHFWRADGDPLLSLPRYRGS